MTTQNQRSEQAALVIVRQFHAPKSQVFNAFADPDAMATWWGPAGHSVEVLTFDFKPGGLFHYKQEMNGQVMYGRFKYGQINTPDLLEFTNAFSDAHGGIIRAPFSSLWPLEIFNRLTFEEKNGSTTITMSGYPVNATREENEMFVNAQANLQQGLEGTFRQLDAYLKNND